MGTAKTTIELNGKLYDARSGRIIGDAQHQPAAAVRQTPRGNMDGVVRRPATATAVPAQAVSVPVKVVVQAASVPKTKPQVSRNAAAHAAPKLQKSQTLTRPAVQKPKPVVKNDVTYTQRVKKSDPQRAHRAGNTPKSHLVQRFNQATPATIVKKEASLPVVAPPAHHVSEQVARLATAAQSQARHSVDIIEESLRNATAHLETYEDQAKRSVIERFGFKHKGANIASLTAAAVLLVGFFAYQNVPNIEMRVAATRSNVSASMPGYSPAGFSASRGVTAEPGKVAVTFRSNTDNKAYTVTQQASNWSSDSLLSNHVLANKKPYQTFQDEGKTIYIYDGSNATWMNGGVWYKVEGDASLTSDQLLRIANSM